MRQRQISWRALGQSAVAGVVLFSWLSANERLAQAQEAKAVPATAQPAAAPAPGAAAPMPTPDGKPPMVGPDGKPVQPMVGPDGKPIQPMPGEAKPMEPAVTQRPMKPATPPSADELKVRPDTDGKLRFSFNGQPWPAVLEWVATISNMSLDWQELPGDYLNLSTKQAYTVEEVRDLINRHLLARGFTMLRQGEMLAVVNVKKLDPGLVPRVSPAELAKRSPYEFVKVSFPLDWLVAEAAVEEFKPMLSPNGKLNALKGTNRIEAIDAVTNLREIYTVMNEEQSKNGQERLVKEFVLDHARASEIEQQLNTLLGIEEKSKKPMTPEEIAMQQQQAMMAQQRGGGQPMPMPEKPKGPPVNLVVNQRKNSIVANAPPDKMAIIEQAIKVLDVQSESSHLLANMSKMQVYRLAAIDPEPIVTTLNDLGVLDPSTRLQVDKKNRSIIAYASLTDHVTIRAMVDKLDGSGRKFEVIQLRRLEADYVAGSLEFMMAGGEKEKSQQRRPYYYDFDFYSGGRRQQEETSTDKFRVDADVENNRLLVWANPIELEEVMNLLAKLGEIPSRGNNTSTVRILSIEPGKDSADALERIRRAWPKISPNPLVMPDPEEMSVPSVKPSRQRPPVGDETPGSDVKVEDSHREARSSEFKWSNVQLVAALQEDVEAASEDSAPKVADEASGDESSASARENLTAEEPIEVPDVAPPSVFNPKRRPGGNSQAQRGTPPAITVTQGPNGELIVTSPDTEALDMFEEMVMQVAPERRDYQVFYLKHASASWVAMKLEDYFEIDTTKKSSANNRFNYWYFGGGMQDSDKNETRRLSKRKNLKFITDIDTNTILVQGADPSQVKIIAQLIELYDQPEPVNSKAARMTVTFTLKYSKAKVVGEAVKDVYRDLLSSNDKALQNQEQQQKNKRPESQNVYITNLGGESEGDEKRTQVSFKGKLSLGIDELSNTLVVSTEGENLMQNVSRMIRALDEAAQPATATVQVLKTGGQMDSDDVRKAIARILVDQQLQKQQQPNGQNGQLAPNQQFPQQQMQQGGNQFNSGNNGGGQGG